MSRVRDLIQTLRPGYSLVVEGRDGENPQDVMEDCREDLQEIPSHLRPKVRVFVNDQGRVEIACYADEG